MKKSLLIITMVIVGFASLAQAQSRAVLESTYSPPYVKAYQSQSAWVGEKGRVRWDMATYSFDRQGGTGNASGLIDLGIVIPDNAVVVDGLIDVIEATLPTTAEISLQLNAANDILGVTSNMTAGIVATVPVGTAAAAVKMTADRRLYMATPTGTLTQGIFKIWIKSYLSQ